MPVNPPADGSPAQLLGTYGQDQRVGVEDFERLRLGLDPGTAFKSHSHEGLDIAAAPGSPVDAVTAGIVEAVDRPRNPNDAYDGFIVMRDAKVGADGKPIVGADGKWEKGDQDWTYKHVMPLGVTM